MNTPDDLNPKYMFNLTPTELLKRIATGEIDAKSFAIKELHARGVNTDVYTKDFFVVTKDGTMKFFDTNAQMMSYASDNDFCKMGMTKYINQP